MTRRLRIPRWNDILIEIYKNQHRFRYCEKLYKIVNCSKTHMRQIVKQLAKHKLITIVPIRKMKALILTKKGEKLIEPLMLIRSEIKHH